MRQETDIFQVRAGPGNQTYKDNKTRFEISVKFWICPQGSKLFKSLGPYSNVGSKVTRMVQDEFFPCCNHISAPYLPCRQFPTAWCDCVDIAAKSKKKLCQKLARRHQGQKGLSQDLCWMPRLSFSTAVYRNCHPSLKKVNYCRKEFNFPMMTSPVSNLVGIFFDSPEQHWSSQSDSELKDDGEKVSR